MLSIYLAHAGEHHDGTVEAAKHTLQIDPVFASILIVIVGALVPFILFKFTKSQGLVMTVGLAELLLVGILTYSILPVLSAISLVVGFTLALVLVFSNL